VKVDVRYCGKICLCRKRLVILRNRLGVLKYIEYVAIKM
jgi:hypothetical protein